MKAGSIGVSAGARRASGVGTASKSFGSSLSPEARLGGSNSMFSSRGLADSKPGKSMFNHSVITSSPKNSIININQGRESRPKFATNNAVRSQKSIFDISRPFAKEKPTFSSKNEFGVKLNINQAREIRPQIARTRSLEPKKSLFDISRPIVRVSPPEKKNDMVIARPLENTAPKTERRANPLKDTVILWQRSESKPKVSEVKKGMRAEVPHFHPKQETHKHTSTRKEHRVSQERKVATQNFKRVELKHMIQILPTISPEKLPAVRLDIKKAKEMIPLVVRARNISYRSAVAEMANTLSRKYEGSVRVAPAAQVVPSTAEASLSQKTELKVQQQAARVVKSKATAGAQDILMMGADEEDKKIGKKEEDGSIIYFYFKKDFRAKIKRVTDAMSVAKRLFSYKREGDVITGAYISYAVGSYSFQDHGSEVAQSVRPDGTLKTFLDKLKNVGQISKVEEAERMIYDASTYDAPVKLSFSPEGEQVGREGAAKVYEGDIEGERAYFEENGRSFGKFKKDEKNIMWFIPEPKAPYI